MDIRPLEEWDEKHLKDVIAYARSDEFDWIELKSSQLFTQRGDKLKDEIAKEVSALANSGPRAYLIIGVTNNGEIDGGIEVTFKNGLKPWLEQVVPDLVEPSVACRVRCITRPALGESKIKPSHAVVVIEIPPYSGTPVRVPPKPGETKGHFYRRIGGESKPMKPGELADFVSRTRLPQLEVISLVAPLSASANCGDWQTVRFRLTIRDTSATKAQHVGTQVFLPRWMRAAYSPQSEGWQHQHKLQTHDVLANDLGRPVFPNQSVSLPELVVKFLPLHMSPRLTREYELFLRASEIGVVLYADDSRPVLWQRDLVDVDGLAECLSNMYSTEGFTLDKAKSDRDERVSSGNATRVRQVMEEYLGR